MITDLSKKPGHFDKGKAMAHWGWYWRVKKNHIPKELCSWSKLCEIDSFAMFKRQDLVRLVKESKDRICLQVPQYNLVAILQDNN